MREQLVQLGNSMLLNLGSILYFQFPSSIKNMLTTKQIFSFVGVVGFSFFIHAAEEDSTSSFRITGEYLTPSDDESSTEVSPAKDETKLAAEDQSGWPAASVVVTHEVSDEAGQSHAIELANGSFVNGNLDLSGEIEEATTVTITVSRDGGDASLTMRTWVVPGGDEVAIAIVDRKVDYRPPRLVLVGASNRVRDNAKKFTIRGDFHTLEDELSLGIVTVSGPGLNDQGNPSRINHGTVLIKDGVFIIESEIHEPSVLYVAVSGGHNAFNEYFGSVYVVAEEAGEIVISPQGWSRELVAAADKGRHQRLVSSWQLSEQYQTLLKTYASSYKDFRDDWEASWRARQAETQTIETDYDATTEESKSNSQNDSDDSTDENTDQEDKPIDIEPVLAFSNGIPPVDECKHVVLADANFDPELARAQAASENPEYHRLFLELVNMRSEALEKLASNTQNPMDILLTMELGAFGYNSENIKQSVPMYEKIATMLDEDIVARRVTPAKEEIADFIRADEIDKSVVPGQLAPEFTLPTLADVQIALQDVVAENEVVLIDFWASWCGPCIAAFPHLKEMYAEYAENGFEIVSVSLDSTQEDWVEASEEQSLPWIDVGNIDEPGEGVVGKAYGVITIPKSFLLDKSRCINYRNLSTEELERVLRLKFDDSIASDEKID